MAPEPIEIPKAVASIRNPQEAQRRSISTEASDRVIIDGVSAVLRLFGGRLDEIQTPG